MRLYEIDEAIEKAFEACLDPETGEIINEAAYDRFQDLQMEREVKLEGVALYVKNLKAEEVALKAEVDALTKRKEATARKAQGLKAWLEVALQGEKLKTPRVVAYTQKAKDKTVIDDATLIPDAFVKIERTPVKTKIQEAIKGGLTVPGAHLEPGTAFIIK